MPTVKQILRAAAKEIEKEGFDARGRWWKGGISVGSAIEGGGHEMLLRENTFEEIARAPSTAFQCFDEAHAAFKQHMGFVDGKDMFKWAKKQNAEQIAAALRAAAKER